MTGKFVGQTFRVVLGVVTYLLAIFFFIGEINRIMDFHPLTFSMAYENMKSISFQELFSLYFSDYLNMLYPVGVLAAFTELPGIIRIFTKGLMGAIKYEMAVGEYDLVNIRTGEVVGHGSDGIQNAGLRILAVIICIALFLPTMMILKPVLLLVQLVKWIRMLVFMFRN